MPLPVLLPVLAFLGGGSLAAGGAGVAGGVTVVAAAAATAATATAAKKVIDNIGENGRIEGKKEGYEKASFEYEQKLLKQAEAFANQTKNYNRNRDEYDALLKECEVYIEQLEKKTGI